MKLHLALVILLTQYVFLNAQNIGLLTPSPEAPVHIASSGQVNVPGGLLLLGSRADGHLEMDFDLLQSRYGNLDVLPLRLQPYGGNVGINTLTPAAPFHVSSSGQVNTPGGLAVFGNAAEGHLEVDFDRIQANNGEVSPLTMHVQPSGGNLNVGNGKLFLNAGANRVGIMDDTPDYTLDVNGDIGIGQSVFRRGDNDTYVRLNDDQARMSAGNVLMLDLVEIAGQDYARLGSAFLDVDVYLNDAVCVLGSNYQVGIGNAFSTPTAQLHVRAENFEDALKVESGTSNRIKVDQSGNIDFGYFAEVTQGTFTSYKPTIINTAPGGVSRALFVQGGGVSNQGSQISGGGLEVGNEFQSSLHIDGDEIQGESGGNNDYSQIKINGRGGNVILGSSGASRIGINTLGSGPNSDLHVLQTYVSSHSASGIRLESNNFEYWRMAINASEELEFYFDGDLKAWLSPEDGAWASVSDRRLKKDIQSLDPVLTHLRKLRPVTYHMLDQDEQAQKIYGFIAQEVQEVFPELVTTSPEGRLGIKYNEFPSIIVKSVQELADANAALHEKINTLEMENAELSERLTRLENLLSAGTAQSQK